jgi:hypothetical protein
MNSINAKHKNEKMELLLNFSLKTILIKQKKEILLKKENINQKAS